MDQKIDGKIIITRMFNAPRKLVWETWIKPEHISKWWGPKGFYTKVLEMDFRPGGKWSYLMIGPDGNEYPWGNSEPDETKANFDNLVGTTTPVTEYEKGKSFYGVYDMAGNVYQWCKDWYATGQRKDKNPTGPDTGKEHVIKGGSFIEGMESIRSANRDRYEPNYSSFLFGFRCACEYDESFSKPAEK